MIETELSEAFFCEQCFKDKALVEIVKEFGKATDTCDICHAVSINILAASHPLLKRAFRAVIRINYSEWDYNHHIGGESLSKVLFGHNNIMNLDEHASEEEFECALSDIESSWYPEADWDISLGGGYWNGNILTGLKNSFHESVTHISRRSFNENYFNIQPEVAALIELMKNDITTYLPSGTKLFRARIGIKNRFKDFDARYHYLPYSGGEISAPPVHLATEGRLNRNRAALLYLATDRSTAIAEVRPHPGHLISTAEFNANSECRIADFSSYDIRNFLSDSRLDDLHRIISINNLLNLPIPPDRRELYIVTQLLSDCIREAGFCGVKFRSSVGDGENVVLFLPDKFSLVPASEKVHTVRKLTYDFVGEKSLSQDFKKEELMEDSLDPMSTLFEVIERSG